MRSLEPGMARSPRVTGSSHPRCRAGSVGARLIAAVIALGCVLPAGALSSGCAGLPRTRRIEHARRADSCARVPRSMRAPAETSVEVAPIAELAPEIRRVARAAGITHFDAAHRAANFERLVLLLSEVNAAASEVDCLADHVEDLEGELRDRERTFELALTLGSIAWGAVASVIAGVIDLELDDGAASAWVQIGGGVGAALLGTLAFFPPSEVIDLEHDRNVIRAIQRGSADTTLPGFVLRLMEEPRSVGPTPRELLLARWAEAIESADGEATSELLLGAGGAYDIGALRVRELMLELLETEIQLESQDLELLLRHLAASDDGR